ncbi:MAG TPA: phenylalanine--tRNA ligase subunit beta, partial [Thermoanaerobaculia bacterium]|nr:phenylalanine--tRNA ligase subunit beta [Thermoanaerobaculia bacterium]
ERSLTSGMLVLADTSGPVALGGVMGGLDSEVTAETTDVLLESAHFDRQLVRATARQLGLHTDASHRFERGVDPEGCLKAADRAAALFAELAGGTVLGAPIDVEGAPIDLERPPRHGRLDLAKLHAFAGAEIPGEDAHRWLAGLGFAPQPDGAGGLGVTVPSWRYFDFEPRNSRGEVYPQDLYEEVMRVFGFDRIPAALPAIAGPDGHPLAAVARRAKIRGHLAACGFAEAINFAFGDPVAARTYPSLRPEARPLPLENPISERASVMRRSLVPGLVESARFNQRRGAPAVRLFEVATVFFDNPDADLPDQPEMVAMLCGGRVGSPWESPGGEGEPPELDLFDLKGVIESLAWGMGAELAARPAGDLGGLVHGTTAELYRPERPEEVVGFFGRVAEEEGYPLYVAEIAAEALSSSGPIDLTIEPPSRFPGIDADLTLTHSLEVSWAQIEEALRTSAPALAPHLVSCGLTVRYRGTGVPAGAVNTTIHFFYNSRERSLTQDEVNIEQQALAADLVRRFGFKE